MVPPWQQFPDIQLGSIGWRMGPGEEYSVAFNDWFKQKHPEAKARYAAENPEPPGWEGFYQRKDVEG